GVSGIPPAADADAAILVVSDETQRERDERSQREFATNAAHELRTPLAAIVTAVEMLQTGAKEDRAARDDFLEVIERESARLTRLTRALLLLARSERGDDTGGLGLVRLRNLFASLPERIPLHAGVSTSVDCPADLEVTANPDLLEQVLVNLATNAAQHTAAGSITFRGRAEDGWALIEISDTGSGIPYRDQRRIFDRFYRVDASDGGFGLGLAIARETIRVLEGEIELDSVPDIGTTVRIRLPLTALKEAA
ncbi:MAG: sensor histidine kinase, partial [Gaiellaceae bacterium]